jgi:NitT/TauT family transport system ATP-binding protein
MTADSPIVSLAGVGKIFGATRALDGFSLSVRRGEFVTLLGASGCGKSTALRILAGLIHPDRGEVTWPFGLARVGFVFQEPTLMPWASVAKNVALPLELRDVSAAESAPRVAAALARVGLSGFTQAYPRELSGGMKMRVSIARAIADEPDVLLMDEPFAALDEITRFRLNDDLLTLWQSLKQTIIFVTHSVFESVYLSQRIVVMRAQPGCVHRELAIDAPFPRDSSFRTSAEYAALCRRVSASLHDAMAERAA